MKKTLLIAGTIFLAACQQNSGEAHDHEGHDHEEHQHEHGGHEEHDDHEGHDHEGHDHSPHEQTQRAAEVELNNGELWTANPETTAGIENMLTATAEFNAESGDYEALKTTLTDEFKGIFTKCTMTGEAHNQLHNYLMPLKGKLDNLSQDNLLEVTNYLLSFEEYFK